jgi:hypothetical protein
MKPERQRLTVRRETMTRLVVGQLPSDRPVKVFVAKNNISLLLLQCEYRNKTFFCRVKESKPRPGKGLSAHTFS